MAEAAVTDCLRDFHILTGLRVSLHDAEFREIASYPEASSSFCALIHRNTKAAMHCRYTDRDAFERARHTGRPYLYQCRFGLWEIACPLNRSGITVGYLMLGQGATDRPSAMATAIEQAFPYVGDRRLLEQSYAHLPCLSEKQVLALCRLVTLCAEALTAEIPVANTSQPLAEAVIRYLNRNIGQKLSVEHICAVFRCSKATLMKVFRRDCGMTMGEYITARRLDIAKELLRYTEEPIGAIAEKCGFPDHGYFSKVFAAHVGMSPLAFRREPYEKKNPKATV